MGKCKVCEQPTEYTWCDECYNLYVEQDAEMHVLQDTYRRGQMDMATFYIRHDVLIERYEELLRARKRKV